jgi:AcrR family transcriptional regulator
MTAAPKFRRRKTARPAEIVAAAQAVFAEKGFAGARLDEIAARAGVSKGALYLYFETKEDLFRAVVHEAVSPNIDAMAAMISAYQGPFADLARMALPNIAKLVTDSGAGAVVKMVIGESRNFPELAKVWHDEVVAKGLGAMTGLIERAQARGEVRPGDPRNHAFSLMSPVLMGVIWRETFTPVGAGAIDLPALALQHVETVLNGLTAKEAPREA